MPLSITLIIIYSPLKNQSMKRQWSLIRGIEACRKGPMACVGYRSVIGIIILSVPIPGIAYILGKLMG
jgi:hypothetical protein